MEQDKNAATNAEYRPETLPLTEQAVVSVRIPKSPSGASPSEIQGRFFLVGCGRSGTTLLQSLLASHSRIASFPETWLFVAVAGYLAPRLYGTPPASLKDRMVRIRDEVRLRWGIAAKQGRDGVRDFLQEIGRTDLMSLFPAEGRALQPQLNACVRILDQLARDQQKPLWLEKSPLHLGYVDLIEKTIPDCRFLHILREGPDAVASLYDATQQYEEPWRRLYPTLDHCILQWNHCLKLTLRYRERPNHIVVRYEQLVADPERELRRLSGFLGVEFEPAMLKNYSQAAKNLTRAREQWKTGVGGAIHSANGTKFLTLFDEAQRRYILNHIAKIPDRNA